MSPVAIQGVDVQGVAVNGVQVMQALSAANSTVNKGVYAATLLETVDADLAVGNIANGVNIFGKVGTLPAGGTETIEKYADATIANAATYTPAASGIFYLVSRQPTGPAACFNFQLYSTLAATWFRGNSNPSPSAGREVVGDGTNFRIINDSAGGEDAEYILMRHYYSTATYERARDEQLAASASWTPAVSGFFSTAREAIPIALELQLTTAGWYNAYESSSSTSRATALIIGDSTNLRMRNTSGATAYYHVTTRAKLT